MAQTRGLTLDELAWVLTLDVDGGSLNADSSYVTEASSSGVGSPYKTAPSSPAWPALPEMPATTEMQAKTKAAKRQERLARNRVYAAVCRLKRNEHAQALQTRVAEIEKTNEVLRAQVEDELRENKRLKAALKNVTDEFGLFIE